MYVCIYRAIQPNIKRNRPKLMRHPNKAMGKEKENQIDSEIHSSNDLFAVDGKMFTFTPPSPN